MNDLQTAVRASVADVAVAAVDLICVPRLRINSA